MVKILIADDHAVVRRGVKQILAEESDKWFFGEARNASEVLKKVQQKHWDILIIDITMPGRSGLDVLRELKSTHPKLPVLVFSMHPEEQIAIRAFKLGAYGYVTKESVSEDLVKAVRKIMEGGKYVSPALAEKLAFDLDFETQDKKPFHEALSDREYEVMSLIASGKMVKDIAQDLYLSVKTVSTYRARILKKLHLKSNTELILYAIENLTIV